MGGSVGKTLGRGALDIGTFGTAEIANRLTRGGLYGATGLSAGPIGNATNTLGGLMGLNIPGADNPYVSGPFSLDPNQVSGDQAAINAEGTKEYGQATDLANSQYKQTMDTLPGLVSSQLALENPDIMESLNRTGQLTSTAYPTELARQQAQLTNAISIPALQQLQGAQTSALQGEQGYQGGAVQRGLSLEDQINNANISKTLGQAFAPQAPSGKSQFGTAAQGIGALAPWGKIAASGKAAAPAAAA